MLESIGRNMGAMGAACLTAALIAPVLTLIVAILGGGLGAIPAAAPLSLYVAFNYMLFVSLFAFPLLPLLALSKRLGMWAQLLWVAVAPVYVALLTTPFATFSQDPVFWLSTSAYLGLPVAGAAALYFALDDYAKRWLSASRVA